MSDQDIIERAAAFATQAHKRIDHRRKYSSQPYDVHLRAVAELVASVTDDAEMVAAAWLHDTVEDTPATFHDIERAFGLRVTQLVTDLTDVSKPSDGNRSVRKAIDCDHIAQACPEAKTVKLADLIDNCHDICRNDPRFSRVFIVEAAALLQVLTEGDQTLYQKATRTVRDCAEHLGIKGENLIDTDEPDRIYEPERAFGELRIPRLFVQAFTAMDIAEPLRSYDEKRSTIEVKEEMAQLGVDVVGIRADGIVRGYLLQTDGGSGDCGLNMRAFARNHIVELTAPLTEVVQVLTRHNHCFLSLLGSVVAMVTRADIQKPVGRMWLFGMITMVEMDLTERLRRAWPDNTWTGLISPGRLEKTKALMDERRKRGQHCELEDCLQLSDKAQILMQSPDQLKDFGFKTKKAAKRAIKELESLRNNLAHSQDIVTHDWAQIARMTQSLHELVNVPARMMKDKYQE